ncbi:hypothetical protein GOP47_0002978 [Adiantum capillus-veneris]|uniref:Uncharacterized protein n=1 Tax=Adiantum capillus-veneris TaxID=13818 RepID=A0A9D4VB41_ADICA|nr:hypothetical protein GOP47_0002978 [Adiantum capillus-veneris]
MWSPGTFQSGNQLEVVQPVLSQRKRSIDLVQQAQFAACSYLGFDPYEEKHKNGVVHQMSTADGSIPLELHLHHHHHHHCRENDDVLKRPSHMSSSVDSPLGVGSLLSICDHIQMFQDAWQGHTGRADERSQKFMLHGSLMKRDSGFAGLEAGLPASNDKKENMIERSIPMCADRYWNGGIAAAPAMAQTVNDNHHFNAAARISHWECSVFQEEKLTKGLGARIGQAERSRPLDTSDFLASSANFGWMANSKHSSSATVTNTTKVERTHMSHSGDASMSSVSTQESLSGSGRKFGSVVTKRKKSFSDMDVGHEQRSLSSSDTASRSSVDTKTVSQSRQTQPVYMSGKKVPGLQLPARSFAAEEFCDSQGCETGRTMTSSCSGTGDGFPLNTGLSLNCDECTCQQSLPTPRSLSSSHQDKQEIMGVQMSVQGLMKDVTEDCSGKFGWDDTSGTRGQQSAERGAENVLSRNAGTSTPKNEQSVAQNPFIAVRDHAPHEFNFMSINTRATRMPSIGYQPHDGGKSKKDGGFQMELCDQDRLEDSSFTRHQVQCKTDLLSKSSLKSLAAEPRREIRPSKLCTLENAGLVNKKPDSGSIQPKVKIPKYIKGENPTDQYKR